MSSAEIDEVAHQDFLQHACIDVLPDEPETPSQLHPLEAVVSKKLWPNASVSRLLMSVVQLTDNASPRLLPIAS